MEKLNIIVIGASSGGIEALTELFRRLEPGLNAAVFIVVHIPSEAKSHLPKILSRLGTLPAVHARDGKGIEPGQAYIAPPNQHLLLHNGTMRLMFGPKENGFRPAVDPLFQSAALNNGNNVIGVILSGNLYDGAKGLKAIKQAGGIAVVQDPEEALYPGMPSSALQNAEVDYRLPVSEIASLLNRLSNEPVLAKGENLLTHPIPDPSKDETNLIKNEFELYENGTHVNQSSVLTCPDCGGVLWETQDDQLVRYRCHIGHVYSAETVLSSRDSEIENAFWTAIRVLIEKAALSKRLALRARQNGNKKLETYYLSQANRAEEDVNLICHTWFDGMAVHSKDVSAGEQA